MCWGIRSIVPDSHRSPRSQHGQEGLLGQQTRQLQPLQTGCLGLCSSLRVLPSDAIDCDLAQQVWPEARQPVVLVLAVYDTTAFYANAFLSTQGFEVLEGTQPYIGRVVPFIRQGFRFGHTSAKCEAPTQAPVREVGKGDYAFCPEPQHFVEHFVWPTYRLQRLCHQHNVEAVVFKVVQSLSIEILLDHRDPAIHAGGYVVGINFQTKPAGIALTLEKIEESAVAAAKVEHMMPRFYPLLDDFKIRPHAPTSLATRSMYAVKISVYRGVGIRNASCPQGASISA